MARNVYRTSPCGKGDNQRVSQVSKEAYGKNYDRVFRKKKKKEKPCPASKTSSE